MQVPPFTCFGGNVFHSTEFPHCCSHESALRNQQERNHVCIFVTRGIAALSLQANPTGRSAVKERRPLLFHAVEEFDCHESVSLQHVFWGSVCCFVRHMPYKATNAFGSGTTILPDQKSRLKTSLVSYTCWMVKNYWTTFHFRKNSVFIPKVIFRPVSDFCFKVFRMTHPLLFIDKKTRGSFTCFRTNCKVKSRIRNRSDEKTA